MVGASKILTVSYGTFSCTLEGFDDPFSTMRGIAEYFRDLAADDRYFGAEPPTPDAEMLHRIAEREVARRVEAQVSDNGITLRQVEKQDVAAAAQPASAPAAPPTADYADDDGGENLFSDIGLDDAGGAATDADDEAEAAMAASADIYGDAEAVDSVPEAFDDNSVAAKLSRIRAAVSRGAPVAAAAPFAGSISTAFQDVDGDAPAAQPAADTADRAQTGDTRAEDGATDEPHADDTPAPEMDDPAMQSVYEADTAEAAEAMVEATEAEAVADLAAMDGTDLDLDDATTTEDDLWAQPAAEAARTDDADAPEMTGAVDSSETDDPWAQPATEAMTEAEDRTQDLAEDARSGDQNDLAAEEPVAETDAAANATENGSGAEQTHPDAADDTPDAQDAAEAADTSAPEADETPAEPDGLAARIVRLKRAAMGRQDAPTVPDLHADKPADPAPERGNQAVTRILDDPDASLLHGIEETPSEGRETAEERADTSFEAAEADVESEAAAWAEAETDAEEDVPQDAPSWDDRAGEAEDDNLFAADAAPDAVTSEESEEDEAPRDAQISDDLLDIDLDELVGRKKKIAPEPEVIEHAETVAPVDETPTEPALLDAENLAAMRAAIAEATSAIDARPEEPEAEDDTAEAEGIDKTAAAFQPEKAGDAAFDRILEQTNSRMDDSEGNRRRSAIAHLKAAVAATKADRLLKRIKQPEEKAAEAQSQYRDDLAQVVRPSRPVTKPRDEAEGHETKRPEMLSDAPAPLVLVSEQRVDDDGATHTASSVAPRRIGGDDADMDDAMDLGDDASREFAEFAEKMGATELPDLLEAAAAYSAFVEGRKEFSRPQLMRRVAGFEAAEFTREAGLRSFGQLLRQGKIRKLKRGQFTVTQDTRFKPDARIAGE